MCKCRENVQTGLRETKSASGEDFKLTRSEYRSRGGFIPTCSGYRVTAIVVKLRHYDLTTYNIDQLTRPRESVLHPFSTCNITVEFRHSHPDTAQKLAE